MALPLGEMKISRPVDSSTSRIGTRPAELVGVPYATDAAAIAATGVPTVVFGPGSIAQAHTADEFIDVDALQLATDIFQKIATEGLRSF